MDTLKGARVRFVGSTGMTRTGTVRDVDNQAGMMLVFWDKFNDLERAGKSLRRNFSEMEERNIAPHESWTLLPGHPSLHPQVTIEVIEEVIELV